MSRHAAALLLASLFLLGGCATTWNMPEAEMLEDIQEQLAKPDKTMSLLWYTGSDDKAHIFHHVRTYFGSYRIYRVPKWSMALPREIPVSIDSKDWLLIEQIGDVPLYLGKENGSWHRRPCHPVEQCIRLPAPAATP
ncbi:hypothetical protein [Chitinilyticum aquatile]|uniref:hypothetical protein n=1 Tax=Chitinilyticum aquatile TaxID=362520 RepID=UPI00042963CD|nr:hypothetical protein [Chitinilyticum aquatile]